LRGKEDTQHWFAKLLEHDDEIGWTNTPKPVFGAGCTLRLKPPIC
jgi:hypothetical protein